MSPIDTPGFKEWFGNSKVVDKDGNPLPVYAGHYATHRFKGKFQKDKATSGRFYFTEDPDIAANYATGKHYSDERDEERGFYSWFKFKIGRYRYDLGNVWWSLTDEQQRKFIEGCLRARTGDLDEPKIVFTDPPYRGIVDRTHWDYEVKKQRGDWMRAAAEVWLAGGPIYDEEEEFGHLLKYAGIPYTYEPPHQESPGVFKVYLSIQNPIDALNVPSRVLQALRYAAKKERFVAKPHSEFADMWDKERISLAELITRIEEEKAKGDGSTYWSTVVPEKAIAVFQQLGYDGIFDKGKHDTHRTWIAFEPWQIKSAWSNKGTYSLETDNISETGRC